LSRGLVSKTITSAGPTRTMESALIPERSKRCASIGGPQNLHPFRIIVKCSVEQLRMLSGVHLREAMYVLLRSGVGETYRFTWGFKS
jgi:hypothetical protein